MRLKVSTYGSKEHKYISWRHTRLQWSFKCGDQTYVTDILHFINHPKYLFSQLCYVKERKQNIWGGYIHMLWTSWCFGRALVFARFRKKSNCSIFVFLLILTQQRQRWWSEFRSTDRLTLDTSIKSTNYVQENLSLFTTAQVLWHLSLSNYWFYRASSLSLYFNSQVDVNQSQCHCKNVVRCEPAVLESVCHNKTFSLSIDKLYKNSWHDKYKRPPSSIKRLFSVIWCPNRLHTYDHSKSG